MILDSYRLLTQKEPSGATLNSAVGQKHMILDSYRLLTQKEPSGAPVPAYIPRR